MAPEVTDTWGVQNVLELGGVMLLPTLLGAAVVGAAKAWRLLTDRRRTALATGPTIERLSADVRRLRSELAAAEEPTTRPGRSVRIRAIRGAYLDALTAACWALEVPPPQPAGAGQVPMTEIYRAEAALRSRGLDVRPAPVP